MHSVTTEIEVPFHDVDSMEIAWHGHYAKYLELARCDLLDLIGYNYKAMKASGYSWPIVDLRIKYIQPLRFGQKICVQARIDEWEHRLKIRYEIMDKESGQALSKAHTTQMAVDMATGESLFDSPAVLKQCFENQGDSVDASSNENE